MMIHHLMIYNLLKTLEKKNNENEEKTKRNYFNPNFYKNNNKSEYISIIKPINNFKISSYETFFNNFSSNSRKKQILYMKNNTINQNKTNSIVNIKFKKKYEDILFQIDNNKTSSMKKLNNHFGEVFMNNIKSETIMSINSPIKSFKNSSKKFKINLKNKDRLKRELFKNYFNNDDERKSNSLSNRKNINSINSIIKNQNVFKL